jgi:hypothetical protein
MNRLWSNYSTAAKPAVTLPFRAVTNLPPVR